ncbi:HD domain-containing protein [Telmatocola sphagniphila]|uniref:HD domain-containing protein n=1 Tax=Telmatocola sphagniphila TaxID=1123043 RepID=A0A8E6EX40_9BACT|nr:HD domain-containing phosphohydrolase [Telmatocola sphagniphila]QVL34675.1 HD domain-containing protein [Telmatocola sphagniphila]
MTDTRALLNRISAFRQRLEQMPRLLPDRSSLRSELPEYPVAESAPDEKPEVPGRLGTRARQALDEARGLVTELRKLTQHALLDSPQPFIEREELLEHHRETTALLNGAIRMIRYLPEPPDEQWLWCESLEASLNAVRYRLAVWKACLDRLGSERLLLHNVAVLLNDIHHTQTIEPDRFSALVDLFLQESTSTSLTWLEVSSEDPASFIARHTILRCRVLRRMASKQDPEFLRKLLAAGLLCDVAMLRLPAGLLSKSDSLSVEDRQLIESHPLRSAEMIRKSLPYLTEVAEIVTEHHERDNGTGYPNSWKKEQLKAESRWLAIADQYSALIEDRPYRPGCDPRTAVTDLLLQMEQGIFDSRLASALLEIGLYPIGSAVELSDGSLAVVLGHPRIENQLAKPLIGVLTDDEGRFYPTLKILDLISSPGCSIVRTLPKAERRKKLSRQHLDWAL